VLSSPRALFNRGNKPEVRKPVRPEKSNPIVMIPTHRSKTGDIYHPTTFYLPGNDARSAASTSLNNNQSQWTQQDDLWHCRPQEWEAQEWTTCPPQLHPSPSSTIKVRYYWQQNTNEQPIKVQERLERPVKSDRYRNKPQDQHDRQPPQNCRRASARNNKTHLPRQPREPKPAPYKKLNNR
jgi:hypothetical protein